MGTFALLSHAGAFAGYGNPSVNDVQQRQFVVAVVVILNVKIIRS